jgi:hypothetical protein
MQNIIKRIDENKFYILYRRILEKKDCTAKYVIYRTQEYGGDYLESFYSLTEARRIFKKVSKEAIECENILNRKD